MRGSQSVVLEGVSKAFDDVAAVDDVSLEVGSGEFFSLLGPSGCGKTTTLRMTLRGYVVENPAARFYRELRVDRIWEGTSEIQRSILSRGVFKRGAAPYLGWH